MTDDLNRFKQSLTDHLDWFADRGLKARFWWRDDDAVEPTALLDRLLALADENRVEIGLAVIPKDATEALARRLETSPGARVLQHGYQHKNFQRKDLGEKAAELGSRRDLSELVGQLQTGKARLEALFGERFLPVMVPPWNRIAPEITRALPELGIKSLSTFTWHHFPRTLSPLSQLQSHIDIIKWKKDRRFIGWESARLRFDLQFCRRRTNPLEPIGILSHHLAHDEGCFAFLDTFLQIAAHHPGADWPAIETLI